MHGTSRVEGSITSRFLERTILEAKSNKQTIVLAEGDDARTLEAAAKILEQDIANLIILGDRETDRKSVV